MNSMHSQKSDNNEDDYSDDKKGQLGLGHKHTGKNYSIPKICSYTLIIKSISCGEEHSAFLTSKGLVYCTGSNQDGRLGIGNRQIKASSSPCLVEELSHQVCLRVACGYNHTCAITKSGEAYAWGQGFNGALGNGFTENQWSPAVVVINTEVTSNPISVSCGAYHTVIITRLGECLSFGLNAQGQLGTGYNNNNHSNSININNPSSSTTRSSNISEKIVAIPTPVLLSNEKMLEVSCGISHTLFLTQRNRVYSTGSNCFGQLGIGNKKNQFVPVPVAQLENEIVVKIAAGHHSAVLNRKGEIYIWGTGVFGEYLTPMKLSSIDSAILDISIGGFFGAAVDINGQVWTWGSNDNGELGSGNYEPRIAPQLVNALKNRIVQNVVCGSNYVMAIGKPGRNNQQKAHRSRQKMEENLNKPLMMMEQEEEDRSGQRSRKNQLSLSNQKKQNNSSYSPLNKSAISNNNNKGLQDSFNTDIKGPNTRYQEKLDSTYEYDTSTGKSKRFDPTKTDSKRETRRKKPQSDIQQQSPITHSMLIQQQYEKERLQQQANKIQILEQAILKEREEKSNLQSQLYHLQDQLSELQFGKGGLNQLSEMLQSQTNQFELLRKSNLHLKEQNQSLQSELHDSQMTSQQYKDQTLACQKRLKLVQEELHTSELKCQHLEESNKIIEAELSEGHRKEDHLENEILQIQNKHEMQQQKQGQELKELRQECESLQKENRLMQDNMNRQDLQIKRLSEMNQQMSAENKQIREINLKQENEIRKINQQRESLLNEQRQSKETVQKQEVEIRKQLQAVERQNNDMAQANLEAQNKNREIAHLQYLIEQHANENNNQREALLKCEDKLSRQERTMQSLQEKNNALERLCDEYKEKVENTQKQLLLEKTNTGSLEEALKFEQSEKEQMTGQLQDLTGELKYLKNLLQEKESQENLLNEEIEKLIKEKSLLQSNQRDYDFMKKQIQIKEDQNLVMESKIQQLLQHLHEVEEKNTKLVQVINDEIENQADQLKNKAIKNLQTFQTDPALISEQRYQIQQQQQLQQQGNPLNNSVNYNQSKNNYYLSNKNLFSSPVTDFKAQDNYNNNSAINNSRESLRKTPVAQNQQKLLQQQQGFQNSVDIQQTDQEEQPVEQMVASFGKSQRSKYLTSPNKINQNIQVIQEQQDNNTNNGHNNQQQQQNQQSISTKKLRNILDNQHQSLTPNEKNVYQQLDNSQNNNNKNSSENPLSKSFINNNNNDQSARSIFKSIPGKMYNNQNKLIDSADQNYLRNNQKSKINNNSFTTSKDLSDLTEVKERLQDMRKNKDVLEQKLQKFCNKFQNLNEQ